MDRLYILETRHNINFMDEVGGVIFSLFVAKHDNSYMQMRPLCRERGKIGSGLGPEVMVPSLMQSLVNLALFSPSNMALGGRLDNTRHSQPKTPSFTITDVAARHLLTTGPNLMS